MTDTPTRVEREHFSSWTEPVRPAPAVAASNETPELDLRRVRRILLRSWALILVFALDVALIAQWWEGSKTDLYVSDASVQVVASEIIELRGLEVNTINDQSSLATVALVLSSPDLRQQLEENLGIPETDQFELETEIVEETDALRITATATSPDLAQAAVSEAMRLYSLNESIEEAGRLQSIIDGLDSQRAQQQERLIELDAEVIRLGESLANADEVVVTIDGVTTDYRLTALNEFRLLTAKRIVELEQQAQDVQAAMDQLDLDYLHVISSPSFWDVPVSPNPRRALVLGFAGGLIIAVFGALAIAGWRDRIMHPDELDEDAGGLPIIATPPKGTLSARNVETARATAGWITGLEENERPGSLLWCEVGKCNSARLLLDAATSIEGEGTSVSLIDLDLHNGGLSALVNSPGGGTLQAVLRGEQAPLEAADLVGGHAGAVHVLSTEKQVRNTGLITRDRLVRLRGILAPATDLTIFAANDPTKADTRLAASACDAVVLVVRRGTTRRRELRAAISEIELAGSKVVAVVNVPSVSRWRQIQGQGRDRRTEMKVSPQL